jgi:hypothetical protein
MFDKYICRIINKPEPTIGDLLSYIRDIICAAIMLIVVIFAIHDLIYTDTAQLTLILFHVGIILFIVMVCLSLLFFYNQIKDKKIAKCPVRKQP